jgi:hypothetical protein
MGYFSFFIQFLLGFVLIISFQNCGQLNSNLGSNNEASTQSFQSCEDELIFYYVQDVKPILASSSCTGCHNAGGIAEATNFNFGSAFTDQETINSIANLTNANSVKESPFIRKPSGAIDHGGGVLIEPGSDNYQKIVAFTELMAARDFCQSESVACGGEEAISTKKIRRLTMDQIQNVVHNTYKGTALVRPDRFGNFSMFRTLDTEIGFDNDSTKLVIDTNTMKAWRDLVFRLEDDFSHRTMSSFYGESSCRWQELTPECLDNAITKLSLGLFRRPLSPEKEARLKQKIQGMLDEGHTIQNTLKALHKYFLFHPLFFFRTEVGLESLSTESIVELDNYEIASFLSFSLLDAPPDEELMNLAAQGQLKNKVIVLQQIKGLVESPSSKAFMRAYFDDLLKLQKIQRVDNFRYQEFAWTYVREQYPNTWRDRWSAFVENRRLQYNLYQDAHDFIERKIGNQLDYLGPFRGQDFDVSWSAAPFFGVTGRELDQDYPLMDQTTPEGRNQVLIKSFPTSERHGILTHPTFLGVHSNSSNNGIVKRGVFAMKQLMCHDMPAAPAEIEPVSQAPEGFDPRLLTSRQKFEVLHSQQQACYFCHKVIDPIGGAFENFSNVGAFSLTERFTFEGDEYELDIDSSGQIEGIDNIDIAYDDGPDFARRLASSEGFKSCMNQRLHEYISGEGRNDKNSCTFEKVDQKIKQANDYTLQNMFIQLIGQEKSLLRQDGGS